MANPPSTPWEEILTNLTILNMAYFKAIFESVDYMDAVADAKDFYNDAWPLI